MPGFSSSPLRTGLSSLPHWQIPCFPVMSEHQPLQRTALYDTHVAPGAKLAPFAGFERPVQYPTGISAEHHAVRT